MPIYLEVPPPEPEVVKIFGEPPKPKGPRFPLIQMISAWPIVRHEQWCGEWRHKLEAVEEALRS